MNHILDKDNVDNGDSISSICANLLDFLENSDKMGIKFGIKFLDDVIGGLFKGELTTIAARSGVGKTALALQIMLNCMEQGKKVLFISREMSNLQVFMRNITKKTGISTKDMKNKEISEESWKKIIGVMEEFGREDLIYINDRISTISELKRRIRQLKVDIVIVDYIQLMTPESNMPSREREVATLSRELKNITLDFNIPVIQLSQLNDEMKDFRPWGERPMRDSKAIFHDSNNVIYIHEPVMGDFDEAIKTIDKDKKSVIAAKKKGIKLVDLVIAKCRDGETGFRHYCYNGPRLHFQHINY
jgi:replicative DNA helicase